MTKRLSITLEPEDERAVESFGTRGTREHEALLAWAAQRGLEVTGSTAEAALLRLLLRAGVESLRTSALDVAYAELAVSMTGADKADSRAARDRYVKRAEGKRAR
jgi:hypothetical protein